MSENNDLSYKTSTEYAHMCGHDGHTTTLLILANILVKISDKMGINQRVWLIFQPAEESKEEYPKYGAV